MRVVSGLSVRCAALVVAALVMAAPAFAQRCFRDNGATALDIPKCNFVSDGGTVYENAPIVRNAKGEPILVAFAVGKQKGMIPPLHGVRDMSGRVLVPARFHRINALSPWLAQGQVLLKDRGRETYLIDLRTGAVRATPYWRVYATYSGSLPALLLGQFEPGKTDAAVLDPSGMETGLQVRVKDIPITDDTWHVVNGPKTLPNGILDYGDGLVTIEGKLPAGGLPLFDSGGRGMMVEAGREAPGATGKVFENWRPVGTLYLPLDGVGQVQAPPPGVLGVVRSGMGWFLAREAPNGAASFQYIAVDGPPDLKAPPSGQQYSELFVQDLLTLGRTPKGWSYAWSSVPADIYPDIKTAVAANDAAAAKLRENIRADAEKAAADAAARTAALQAERDAQRAAVFATMDQAKAEKWGVNHNRFPDLRDKVTRMRLQEEYRDRDLPMTLEFEREACRDGVVSFCNGQVAANAPGGSAFQWTFQQSFEAASALNRSQAAENCAAALKGAARFCSLP